MWTADRWKDYEILDTSGGEKLERWGEYLLIRPDPQVIWNTPRRDTAWKRPNAHYHRSAKGGGSWEFFSLPEMWPIRYGELTFQLKPFQFKHTDRKNELIGASEATALIIQALRALGKENIDSQTVSYLSGRLSAEEKQQILQESRYVTAWVYEAIKEICGGSEPCKTSPN